VTSSVITNIFTLHKFLSLPHERKVCLGNYQVVAL
jgi:hypothetical protein